MKVSLAFTVYFDNKTSQCPYCGGKHFAWLGTRRDLLDFALWKLNYFSIHRYPGLYGPFSIISLMNLICAMRNTALFSLCEKMLTITAKPLTQYFLTFEYGPSMHYQLWNLKYRGVIFMRSINYINFNRSAFTHM